MAKAKKITSESINSPKGMRDIMGQEYYDYQGFFEKAQEIAIYYGFKPIETPVLEREDVFTSGVGQNTDIVEKEMYFLKAKGRDHLVMRPEGTAAIARAYIEHGMRNQPQPVMLYYYGPFFRHERPQKGRLRELRQFGVEILGTDKSVADAIVIKTTMTILEEAGFKNLSVQINSIGDKVCRVAYIKALTAYYKKQTRSLCPHCVKRLKTNPLRLLDCKNKKCIELKEEAPQTVGFLCNDCKKHFKEVLEHLEASEIPYMINSNLVRGIDYYTKTVFEIISEAEQDCCDENSKDNKKEIISEPLSLAGGGRYDYLLKKLGHKKDVQAVGASIGVDRVIMSEEHTALTPRIIKKPKIYFIQLGFEAKMKSLTIIEVLRKARIPVAQSLSKDNLSSQLAMAEKMKVPYTIIFGQKEALDGTVIVRKMKNRSQKSVKIEKLSDYIKHLK